MSNRYSGAVVVALRKSQLLLEAAPSGEQPLLSEGLQEGVLTQLWRAYRAFLAEQACQLQLAGEPSGARELHQMAADQGVLSAEVGELFDLQEDRNSWLAAMDGAWERLWQFSKQAEAQSSPIEEAVSARLIPLREASATEPPALTWEVLHCWQQALTELIHRQRAQAQEW